MSSITEDIVNSVVSFFVTELSDANTVELSYKDERTDDQDETDFPKALITLYDFEFDSERRHGGISRTVSETDPPSDDVEITKLPIPVNYYFQLDTLVKDKKLGWQLDEAVKKIAGRRYSYITLSGGTKLFIIPIEMTPLSGLAEGTSDIIRTTFRFLLQHWIPDRADAVLVPKVLTLRIHYEDKDYVEETG